MNVKCQQKLAEKKGARGAPNVRLSQCVVTQMQCNSLVISAFDLTQENSGTTEHYCVEAAV